MRVDPLDTRSTMKSDTFMYGMISAAPVTWTILTFFPIDSKNFLVTLTNEVATRLPSGMSLTSL